MERQRNIRWQPNPTHTHKNRVRASTTSMGNKVPFVQSVTCSIQAGCQCRAQEMPNSSGT